MTDDIKKIAESALKKAGKHQIKIKDKTYTIKLLPATQALAVATQLFKVALPALGAWADGSKREGLVLPEEDSMFTEMAVLIVSQLEKVSVLDLVTLLSQDITCNGDDVDINEEFKGNLAGLLILLEFILKENCGPFMKEWLEAKGLSLPSLAPRKKAPTKKRSNKE